MQLAYIFVLKISATIHDISPGLPSTKMLLLIILCKLLELSGTALFPRSSHWVKLGKYTISLEGLIEKVYRSLEKSYIWSELSDMGQQKNKIKPCEKWIPLDTFAFIYWAKIKGVGVHLCKNMLSNNVFYLA